MRTLRRSWAVLGITLGIFLLTVSPSSQGRRVGRVEIETLLNRDVAAREVLVRLTDPSQQNQLARLLAAADLEGIEALGRSGILRLRSRSLSTSALLSALSNLGGITVEPNFVVRALAEPNDPLFPSLWGMQAIHAPQAWDVTVGSNASVVAVIDTGIDYNHPDLVRNIWSAPAPFTVTIGGASITCAAGTHGFNAIDRTCDPMDDHNHGTHVAGTIGADGNNGIGVAGVNHFTSIMGLKFLDSSGSGTVADAVDAIEFAIQAKQAFSGTGAANVRVLSNSWGGGDFSQALLDEINAANAQNMLFVAAAGNNGLPNDVIPLYPASYSTPNMIAVAATTSSDTKASFSNYGANSVHLGAPGVDILSTVRAGGYASFSGTSMATPHVSGAAALVLSYCVADTAQLKATLLDSVDAVAGLAGATITGGRLNADTAVRSCSTPPGPPSALRAAGGNQQIRLDWTAGSGATRYNIKRSLAPGGPYTVVAANVKGVQYFDNGLINGTPYYYVVSSANLAGVSGDSNEASATPNIQADMVVSSFSVPNYATPGQPLTVLVTTKNQGSGTAAPTLTKFVLSVDTVIGPGDIPLPERQTVPSLAPGVSLQSSISLSIPAQIAGGTYYLVAAADADDVLFETEEDNNLRLRQVSIGPDLTVTSISVPPGAAPGVSLNLPFTVANIGTVAAPPSALRVYWSTNTSLDAADTPLTTASIGGIAVSGSVSGEIAVTIPANAAVGAYYVIAEADATDSIEEVRENNNTASASVKLGGDLIVTSLTIPTAVGAGIAFQASDTTKNDGGVGVGATVTTYYLSTDAVLSANDPQIGSRAVGALASLNSSAGPATLTIPGTTAAGSYYIFAKADGANAVSESQETNNTSVKTVKVGPDLTADIQVLSNAVVAGSTGSITESVKNSGGADTGAFNVGYYLSTDVTLDAGDVRLAERRTISSLAVGVTSQGTTVFTIPSGTAKRSYYIIVKADADGSVAESSETNNTWARTIRVD
jgi:subtilisin family serine protease